MERLVYRFDGARFDMASGELAVDGRTCSLRPRTGAVLAHLLKNAGTLVTKEELLRSVWTDLVVTENSLSQCIREIRKELGAAADKIRNVHGRGYVLDAAVDRGTAPPRTAPASRLSLMVLPLVNLGGDPDHDFFAEGLTEDLTMDLGRMPEAFVIARGTALAYADRRVDARQIGQELGVRYLVEGSVRRGQREVVVNLSVCDTRDARQVWAERLTADRSDLLSLQRSMAGKVAHMLHLDLLEVASESVDGARMDAHELAMRAFSLKVRSLPNVSPEASELVRRALELDPGCAYAWTVKAESHVVALATRNFDDWAATIGAAEQAARMALELEPESRTAHHALGSALVFQNRLEEALAAFERQIAMVPNFANAYNWIGLVHTLMGNPKLAIPAHEHSIELSPRDPRLSTWISGLARALLCDGQDARALREAERSVNLPNPWPRSYETLAMAYAVNGLLDDARAAARVVQAHWPGYSIAQHRAELRSDRPAFLERHERLIEGLRMAGIPEGVRVSAPLPT